MSALRKARDLVLRALPRVTNEESSRTLVQAVHVLTEALDDEHVVTRSADLRTEPETPRALAGVLTDALRRVGEVEATCKVLRAGHATRAEETDRALRRLDDNHRNVVTRLCAVEELAEAGSKSRARLHARIGALEAAAALGSVRS